MGTYNPTNSSTDVSECLPCPLGTYNDIQGRQKYIKYFWEILMYTFGQAKGIVLIAPLATSLSLTGQANVKGAAQVKKSTLKDKELV